MWDMDRSAVVPPGTPPTLAERYLLREMPHDPAAPAPLRPQARFASVLDRLPDFWDPTLSTEAQAQRLAEVQQRQQEFVQALGYFDAPATFELRLLCQPNAEQRVRWLFVAGIEDGQRAEDAWRLFHANFPSELDYRLTMVPKEEVAALCNPFATSHLSLCEWVPHSGQLALPESQSFGVLNLPEPRVEGWVRVLRLLAQQMTPLLLGFSLQPIAYQGQWVDQERALWRERLTRIEMLLALTNSPSGTDTLNRRFYPAFAHMAERDLFGKEDNGDELGQIVAQEVARGREGQFYSLPLDILKQAQEQGRRGLVAASYFRWRVYVAVPGGSLLPEELVAAVASELGRGSDAYPPARYELRRIDEEFGAHNNFYYVRMPVREGPAGDDRVAATLFQLPILPRGGIPGLPTHIANPFATWQLHGSDGTSSTQALMLGDYVDSRSLLLNEGGQHVTLSPDDLTRHALITGSTGAGKSTTCKRLLLELHRRRVPFLVIEPVKSEYADLAFSPDFFRHPLRPLLDLHILGSTQNRFWFNPFYVRPGVSLNTHLSYLLSCFLAAFPMPGVFGIVFAGLLHRAYELKLNTFFPASHKPYGGGQIVRERLPDNAFPTLEDLVKLAPTVIKELQYQGEFAGNLNAAIAIRLKWLQSGVVGELLTPRTDRPSFESQLENTLRTPTVLQLTQIADKSEKALVMAFILTALYEYYETQPTSPTLRHVTLIEEAHVLLENVPRGQSEESANTRGKAIELFADMLAEVRSRGEGLIIAEQLPSKLIPEAIKNTNLKIMHRLSARDDREILGASMNLTERQSRFAATLVAGQAILFREGLSEAALVQIRPAPEHSANRSAIERLVHHFRLDSGVPALPPTIRDALRHYEEQYRHDGPATAAEALFRTVAGFLEAQRIPRPSPFDVLWFIHRLLSILPQPSAWQVRLQRDLGASSLRETLEA